MTNKESGEQTFYPIHIHALISLGTAVTQWLGCCATKRKVAGSIPTGVTGIFH